MKITSSVSISNQKVILVTAFLAAFIQLIIIIYTHFTGYYINTDLTHFIIHWLFASFLSWAFLLVIAFLNIRIINELNIRLPWKIKTIQRIFVELMAAVVIGTIVSVVPTVISHLIGPYENGLGNNLINNALITAVLNIIIITLLEAWFFYNDSSVTKKKAEELEKELNQIRFEVLKSQLNPHFMFNSLNVLSGLVGKDTHKAQQFIDEFAMVYRYVLETIEKKVVILQQELGFVRSYMALQQMRYGKSLTLEIKIDGKWLDYLMPPLSLQVVLENAIKHNVVNDAQPLFIDLFVEDGMLMIKNNIQHKISAVDSTKVGQQNLVKRYKMLDIGEPIFQVVNSHYIVKLPLITNE